MSSGLSAGDFGDLEDLTFENGGVRLHAAAAGPHGGPVVILLHGFPEFWYGWRKQICALAASGFRVIAPDQRGYNTSSKPARVVHYQLRELVSDVAAIIGQLGAPRVYLAGHDWGAIVAWAVAAWHKEKVARLAILNVPHPGVLWRFLLTHPSQLRRSWYMFFFQIPRLPELLFSARKFRAGVQSLVRTSRPGTFSRDELAHYQSAWAQPGAVTAMIHWYRALFRYPGSLRVGRIEVPTRILWGRKDAFLHPSLATVSRHKCALAEVIWFDQATHWLHLEEPEAISSSLIQFFSELL